MFFQCKISSQINKPHDDNNNDEYSTKMGLSLDGWN